MSVRVRRSWALRTHMGNSMIEVIIAMALLLMFTIAFLQMSISGSDGDFRARKISEANAFARQGLEAARSIAEQDFQQLTVGNHGIGIAGSVYAFSGSTNSTNGYTRTVTVDLVRRNAASDIVQSGGDIDYDTRSVSSKVEWMEGARARSTLLTTYLTDWRKIPLAGLIVQKIVINNGGSKVPADFAPYLVGTGTVTLGEVNALEAGTYTVYETTNPNYLQTFGDDCDISGNVTLEGGDAKTCTITNTEKRATVIVNKTVLNHGGTKVAADFAPYKVGTTTVVLGSGTTIDTGTYTVSETVDTNYLQTFSGDCDTAGQITLGYDDVKTCLITNEEKVLPVVTTPTVTSITTNSAILGANVTNLGFPASISARGTCWGITPSPTTNCVAEGGTTSGVFSHARTGLTAGITYYFRGFVTNSVGTTYSPDGTFTTTSPACSAGTSLVGAPTLFDSSKTSSAVVDKPIGVVEGDIMFAHILHEPSNNSDRLTGIPAGWSELGRHRNGRYNQALYYKISGASEDSSYTFGFTSNPRVSISISAYRGCFNTSNPIDVFSNDEYVTSNAIYRAASMTVSSSGTTVLMFPSVNSTTVASFASPTTQGGDWIEDYDQGATTSNFSRAVYRKLISVPGILGVIDSIGTVAATEKHTFAVGLNP